MPYPKIRHITESQFLCLQNQARFITTPLKIYPFGDTNRTAEMAGMITNPKAKRGLQPAIATDHNFAVPLD